MTAHAPRPPENTLLPSSFSSVRARHLWYAASLLLAVASTIHSRAAAQDDAALEESSEDLTETIPAEGDAESGEAVEEVETDAEEGDSSEGSDASGETRMQISGYARESMELVYGELSRLPASSAADSDATSCEHCLWRDVFVSRSQLFLRSSYLRGRSFEATLSGLLSYALHVARSAPVYSIGVVDLNRGDLEAELRDAYLGFFWPAVDLRIGQQRIAWGRSDFQSPNDVVNPRDLRDPFLTETELRYLPTFAVRSSINAGSVSFETVVSPFFVPDRLDVYGSNWSPIQRRAPRKYQEFLGGASLLVDASVEREFAQLWRQTERPTDFGKGAAAGARLALTFSGTDVSAYYHYGYDSTPYVSFHPRFLEYLQTTDLTVPAATKFAPILQLLEERVDPISVRYLRRHHVGLDFATTLGPIVMRLDGAYQSRRVFYAGDLTGFAAPAVLGVFGLEYQTGSLDDTMLFELWGTRLLREPASPLLGYEQTSVSAVGTVRWTLGASWGIDLRGMVGIQPETQVFQPALRYAPSDTFSLKLGALFVNGKPGSFGWYFGDNDSAFVQLRYAF